MANLLRSLGLLVTGGVLLLAAGPVHGDGLPALNPFGPRNQTREDAVPGYVELSDGTIRTGQVYLTRELRLKIFDEAQNRQREVPLTAIQKIDCGVVKEWVEKEWRFKENANDEKVYTGHSYPSREYVYTITLKNGKTIKGPLSGIIYVQGQGSEENERFLLHKRDKGELDQTLKELLYVRTIRFGDKALEEGQKKAQANKKAGNAKSAIRK